MQIFFIICNNIFQVLIIFPVAYEFFRSIASYPYFKHTVYKEKPEHYGKQLNPMMPVLFEKGYDGLSVEGGYFERALYRATLKAWEDQMARKTLWNGDKSYD